MAQYFNNFPFCQALQLFFSSPKSLFTLLLLSVFLLQGTWTSCDLEMGIIHWLCWLYHHRSLILWFIWEWNQWLWVSHWIIQKLLCSCCVETQWFFFW